jgi:hypothetical protein
VRAPRPSPQYIDAVKRLTKLPVNVVLANDANKDRGPERLVGSAIKLLRDKRREEKQANLGAERRCEVWLLIDHDGRDHNVLSSVLAQAGKDGVRVAFSHPCFELWRLLHLKPVSGTFSGVCGHAARRLPSEFSTIPGGIKYVIPEQIQGRYEQARKRALEMNAQHDAEAPLPSRDPYTNVHQFVAEGMGVTSY